MHAGNGGDPVRPIFVLSLPRSGSTLLQRLLGAHSRIATESEPWFLLPLLYSVRPSGAYAEYGHRTAAHAISDLCSNLPGGTADYLEEVSGFAERLYGRLAGGEATYFVDKTPRYALIAEELLSSFPHAKFIVLWRNPLAVVASCVTTFVRGRWMPSVFKIDLFESLDRLFSASQAHADRIEFVRYEDLVTRTDAVMQRLLRHLALPEEAGLASRFTDVQLKGRVGDPTGIHAYDRVTAASADRWKQTLASPVRIAWCRRYLDWVGPRRLALMGYEIDRLRAELDSLPRNWAAAPRDVATTVRGVLRDATEPVLFSDKARSLPAWHRVGIHS